MTKKKRKRLYALLKQWTRAEIMARHSPLGDLRNLTFIDFAMREVRLRDKIRKLMFGSSDLVTLGLKWNLLKKTTTKK